MDESVSTRFMRLNGGGQGKKDTWGSLRVTQKWAPQCASLEVRPAPFVGGRPSTEERWTAIVGAGARGVAAVAIPLDRAVCCLAGAATA